MTLPAAGYLEAVELVGVISTVTIHQHDLGKPFKCTDVQAHFIIPLVLGVAPKVGPLYV